MKKLLIASLILNLLAGIFAIKKVYQRYQDRLEVNAKESQISYWLNRDEVFEKLPIDSNSIVFIGTSLTQHFELAEIFQNLKIKNRGITGDDLRGITHRLEAIIRSNPEKIFIEAGINDLALGHSVAQILNEYQLLIETLQKRLPKTKLYIQSILPTVIGSEYYKSHCNQAVNQKIVKLNTALQQFAAVQKITFINTYPAFALEGQLNPTFSADGLHINGTGYLLWAKILRTYLED